MLLPLLWLSSKACSNVCSRPPQQQAVKSESSSSGASSSSSSGSSSSSSSSARSSQQLRAHSECRMPRRKHLMAMPAHAGHRAGGGSDTHDPSYTMALRQLLLRCDMPAITAQEHQEARHYFPLAHHG